MSIGTDMPEFAASYEWLAFEGILPGSDPSASVPGAVMRNPDGSAQALHFSPARWLLPTPTAAWIAQLIEAEAAGIGVLTDITGRRELFSLTQSSALDAALPVDFALSKRGVAALSIFDCPVLIARCGTGFEVWVETSYAISFGAVLMKIGELQT